MSTPTSDDAGDGEQWRRSAYPRWAVLDPAGESGTADRRDRVYSTVYVPDELIIDGRAGANGRAALEAAAGSAGWVVGEGPNDEPYVTERGEAVARTRGASRAQLLRLTVAPSERTGVVAARPDAWKLLRQLRADGTSHGVSLNHVLSTDSMGLNPFKANPFKANPFKANPFKANAAGVGIDSYASPGFGGRQPVSYVGDAPRRGEVASRPVVAVFDTGIGRHPWFGGDVVVRPVLQDGQPIGISRDATDPETHPSLAVPLDGIFDDAAGHGTFIAGIILQQCGDAQILPVRVADGDGVIVEFELLGALGRLIDYIDAGKRVDVLNLSFGYYSETPDDVGTVSELTTLLEHVRKRGVVVVCSAGNEATDRPAFPAALPADASAHVSVGALNPANGSIALFSNIGDWVDVYAPGVAIVSTVPVGFDGGMQAGTRDDKHGRRRETLDVDDFRGGFGVWSGTSFAAPVVAGRIAAKVLAGSKPAEAVSAVLKTLKGADRSR